MRPKSAAKRSVLDPWDRVVINALQGGLPLSDRPYRDAARAIGLTEGELLESLGRLLEIGALSRFGPMYHAERLGGGLTLAALKVPSEDYDRVTEIVNAFPEVAHNYARDHALNMWFVLATETPQRIAEVCHEIEDATGLGVYNMPKQEEFFVGLRFEL